ncbi:MAG TPA: ATP-dependent Clp protease proteolytic subunit [Sedimentisphaerales bacterium]
MRTFKFIVPFLLVSLGLLLPGCSTPQQSAKPEAAPQLDTRVDFNDPLLNSRKILLFGLIDQQTADVAIQKLLFLDSKGHDPIDLFLETPGGDMKYGWAIQQTIRLIHSPVNTYALSECNSSGAMLLAAGTGKRRTFHGAVIVIHGLQPGVAGDKPPAAYVADIQDSYTDFWHKSAKLPESWLPLPFGIFHILTAEQALKCGIVDEVIDHSNAAPPNTAPEPTPTAH